MLLRNILIYTFLVVTSLFSQEIPLGMSWEKERVVLLFEVDETHTYFEMALEEAHYSELPEEVKAQFSPHNGRWIVSLGEKIPKVKCSEKVCFPVSLYRIDEAEYFLAPPRFFSNATPNIQKDPKAVAALISNKKVLYYTGAGLSAASGIPMMKQLEESMGISRDRAHWIPHLAKTLSLAQERVLHFRERCCNATPSKGHYALAEALKSTPDLLLTENLDQMHEKSGIAPKRIHVERIKSGQDLPPLHEIECLICIGLSHDDKGFIRYYKEKNPQGKIVALNLEIPQYLSDEDLLLQGDIQETLPALLNP